MEPVSFNEENITLEDTSIKKLPFPEIICARIERRSEIPYTMTVWKLTKEEFEKLKEDPRIAVVIIGSDTPLHKPCTVEEALNLTEEIENTTL